MTMPDRYNPDYDLVDIMDKHPYGLWVRFDDYSTLQDTAEELARALEEALGWIGSERDGDCKYDKLCSVLERYNTAITP